VWLGATSSFKSESDLAKYEKARKLKDYIVSIRRNYTADWDSSDLRKKQVSVLGERGGGRGGGEQSVCRGRGGAGGDGQ
jgi:hypothetical protein